MRMKLRHDFVRVSWDLGYIQSGWIYRKRGVRVFEYIELWYRWSVELWTYRGNVYTNVCDRCVAV